VYMKRLADALDQGYVKCPVCEPWEPDSLHSGDWFAPRFLTRSTP
jgi:hypothetical protein